MAKQKRKPTTKRKPEKKALVFQLGEFTSLPNFVRVCREIAKCPARHRPLEEYLRWTFIIVHQRWADELMLPPHDPSLPKEADGDYVPGFASGLYDLLETLPGFNAVVPPTKGQALYFVEDHVELSVAQVSDHLRGRGFEIVSSAELLATYERIDDAHPDVGVSPERLLQGKRAFTWEAPEDGWQDRVVDQLVDRGMPILTARGLVVRHVVHDQTLGLSDALWVLVHRADLRARFAEHADESAEVERAIQRALKLVRSTFGLKFPRDV